MPGLTALFLLGLAREMTRIRFQREAEVRQRQQICAPRLRPFPLETLAVLALVYRACLATSRMFQLVYPDQRLSDAFASLQFEPQEASLAETSVQWLPALA